MPCSWGELLLDAPLLGMLLLDDIDPVLDAPDEVLGVLLPDAIEPLVPDVPLDVLGMLLVLLELPGMLLELLLELLGMLLLELLGMLLELLLEVLGMLLLEPLGVLLELLLELPGMVLLELPGMLLLELPLELLGMLLLDEGADVLGDDIDPVDVLALPLGDALGLEACACASRLHASKSDCDGVFVCANARPHVKSVAIVTSASVVLIFGIHSLLHMSGGG